MSKLDNLSPDDLLAQATCAVLVDGKIKGTAWLVSNEGHLLTAGHLLGKTIPLNQVEVQFEEDIPRKVHKIQWGFQQDMGDDFAILKLTNPLVSRHPLPISLAKEINGTFKLRGYGITLKDQSGGTGIFLGPFDPQNSPGNRLFQLRSPELGEGGYSGAAVFSNDLQAVVAVQIEATTAKSGAGRDTILAMPLYRIAQRWELLYDFAHPKSNLVTIEIGGRQLPRPREYLRFRSPKFVGRQDELVFLLECLLQGQSVGLYAIRGMGGIGKSALAAELAFQLDDPNRFPGGILWANLAEETPSLIAARWLENYGEVVSDNETARLAKLATILGSIPTLVVLDNAQDTASVRKLLINTPGVGVLITTRKQSVIPLGIHSIALDQLSLEDSIKLLASYAGSERVHQELKESETVSALCGYLPLALTLAGAQLVDTQRWPTIGKYRSRLEQNPIGMLSTNEYSENNIRITFEISYEHISDNSLKSLFAELGLFTGETFSNDAVSALSKTSPRDSEISLEALVNLSLILRVSEERYRLHDLLREYAIEKLSLQPIEEINECKRRLILYYKDYANRFRNVFNELEVERDNLLEAIKWVQNGLGNGNLTDAMIDLVTALTGYFKAKGLWVEAATLGETAFVKAESRDLLEAQAELATSTLSWMYYYQEKFDLAEKWARIGMDLYTKSEDEYGRGVATRRLGMILQSQGDESNARILLEEALRTFRQLKSKSKIADTLTALGYVERKCKNFDIAEKYLQEALQIVESISDQKEISLTLYQLGRLAWVRGDLKVAESLHTKSLDIDISLNRKPGIAYNQLRLGLIEEEFGNKTKALELLMLSMKLFDNMGAQERVKRINESLNRLKSS